MPQKFSFVNTFTITVHPDNGYQAQSGLQTISSNIAPTLLAKSVGGISDTTFLPKFFFETLHYLASDTESENILNKITSLKRQVLNHIPLHS